MEIIVLEVTEILNQNCVFKGRVQAPKQKLFMLFCQWRNETTLIIDSERRKIGYGRKHLRFSTCQRKVNSHHSQTLSLRHPAGSGVMGMTPWSPPGHCHRLAASTGYSLSCAYVSAELSAFCIFFYYYRHAVRYCPDFIGV